MGSLDSGKSSKLNLLKFLETQADDLESKELKRKTDSEKLEMARLEKDSKEEDINEMLEIEKELGLA